MQAEVSRMRPVPHPENKVTETSRIDELVGKVLEQLRHDPGAGDIEYTIQRVIPHFDYGVSEELVERAVEKVKAELPDEFQYDRTHDTDYGLGLEIHQGCPHCGNEVLFNVSIDYEFAQMVSYEEEEGNQKCFIDDAKLSFTRITCGCCHEPLVENADSKE